MKIVIDFRIFGTKSGGLGRYNQEFLKHLKNLDQKNEYILLFKEDPKLNLPDNFKMQICNCHWYSIKEQIVLPWVLYKLKPDLVHFTHFNVPIFYYGKFVVTIHDLIMTKFPSQRASTLSPVLFKVKYWFYKQVIRNAVKNSKKIIAVSKFTAKDIKEYFKLDDINDAIDKFSLYKTHVSHASYYERINSHCKVNDDFHEIILLLEDPYVQDVLKDKGTFMHGDLSLENIIQTDKGLYFIDPIYREDQWSSYLLDISKMIHSYRKYNRMFEYEVFLNTWVKRGEDEYVLRLLEVTQWIRIIRYAPKDQQDRLKQITKNLLEEIIIKRSHKI
jgi:glycosyltransferase involved in cell wall biosynthesis